MALPTSVMHTEDRGFTLLYAMIVVSIVLTVSSGIMSIMIKEIKLSGYGKESQVAYYAAESGGECILYWVALGTITGSTPASITCADKPISGTNQFSIDFSPNPGCAVVTVIPGTPITIQSRGYNTCATSRLKVERGIQVVY